MAPDRAIRACLLLPILLVGCQLVQQQIGELILSEGYELSFDRSVDLIPPDGLRVLSNEERQIALAWNPVLVGDVAGYAITRASDPAGTFTPVGQTTSRFDTMFEDAGDTVQRLGDGQTFHYRVHPHDPSGRVSRSHAYISATTEERPDVPLGLSAYSNLPREVVLVWEPNTRRSASGYGIERSPTVSGPWERIGTTDGRLMTQYEDPVPGDLRVLYYRLVARNRFGGESDASEAVRAVTKAEPLPPIGLHVRGQGLGRIELGWEPNVETDLSTYEVWRAERDDDGWDDGAQIGSIDGVDTDFADERVGCGQPLRYRLRATDADGLVSGFSSPLEVRGQDIGLELEPPRMLRWDRAHASWDAIRVLRRRTGLPDQEIAVVEGASSLELVMLPRGRHHLIVMPSARGEDGERLEVGPDSSSGPRTRCEVEVLLP